MKITHYLIYICCLKSEFQPCLIFVMFICRFLLKLRIYSYTQKYRFFALIFIIRNHWIVIFARSYWLANEGCDDIYYDALRQSAHEELYLQIALGDSSSFVLVFLLSARFFFRLLSQLLKRRHTCEDHSFLFFFFSRLE